MLESISGIIYFVSTHTFSIYPTRVPEVRYPKKMSQKSELHFVTMKPEDPASNSGIISLYKVKHLLV